MGRDIPIQCNPVPSTLEVDGTFVARALGLEVARFRQLMDTGRVKVLCERGTGDDDGLVRATFYHGGRRVRLVLDGAGRVLQQD